MIYSLPARPMQLPTSLEHGVTRPVTAIADNPAAFRDPRQQQPSSFVYRGDLLENAGEREYRPQYNLQISPENRRAINSYQKVAEEPQRLGRILDGYI